MDLLRRLLLVLCVSIGALYAGGGAAGAEGRMTREYDLKAIFLFQFAHFVNWPSSTFPDAGTPITIGVLGKDPFGAGLDEVVAGETVGSRKLVVRRFRTIDQVDSCQVLFICASEAARFEYIHSKLSGRSVLTVGETKDFATRYGIVGFDVQKNRLRLRINTAAADSAKLTISSKLLRQAELVAPKG